MSFFLFHNLVFISERKKNNDASFQPYETYELTLEKVFLSTYTKKNFIMSIYIYVI